MERSITSSGTLQRTALVGVLVTVGIAVVALEVPVCPTANLFGIPCPGCGLTRATLALLRGDVAAAFHHHPLVFVLSPVYFGLLGTFAVGFIRGPRPGVSVPTHVARRRTWVVSALAGLMIALLFAIWIARFFGYFGGPESVGNVYGWLGLTR